MHENQQRQGIVAAEDPTNEELLASGAVRQYLETTEGRHLYAQYINATEQTNTTENETNENTEDETNKNTENETNKNTENETNKNETNENKTNETNENTETNENNEKTIENTETSETAAGISLPQKEKCYTKEYWIERAAVVAQQMSDNLKLTPLQRRVTCRKGQAGTSRGVSSDTDTGKDTNTCTDIDTDTTTADTSRCGDTDT